MTASEAAPRAADPAPHEDDAAPADQEPAPEASRVADEPVAPDAVVNDPAVKRAMELFGARVIHVRKDE